MPLVRLQLIMQSSILTRGTEQAVQSKSQCAGHWTAEGTFPISKQITTSIEEHTWLWIIMDHQLLLH